MYEKERLFYISIIFCSSRLFDILAVYVISQYFSNLALYFNLADYVFAGLNIGAHFFVCLKTNKIYRKEFIRPFSH